jgi:hypothetical protein
LNHLELSTELSVIRAKPDRYDRSCLLGGAVLPLFSPKEKRYDTATPVEADKMPKAAVKAHAN